MRKIVYRTDTFGDVTLHKCLEGLTGQMNKMVDEDVKGRHKAKYLCNLISKYNLEIGIISRARGMITVVRYQLLTYLLKDYSEKVKAQDLPDKLRTHILCFLKGKYRRELKNEK